jgi:adenylate cyclase
MLAPVLDLPLLRAPAGLSPDEARLYTVRLAAPLIGALLHTVQLGVFAAIGLPWLGLVSLGSVALFVVAFLLARAGWGRTAMFLVYGEVAAHAVVLTLLIGLGAGYMSYYFALVAAPFLVFRASEWRSQAVSVALAFLVAPLVVCLAQRVPPAIEGVPPATIQGLAIMNVIGTLVALLIMVVYFAAATDRAEAALTRERDRSEKLLLNVLPAPIAARLKDAPGTIADSFPAVTVLFADLVGFTTLAASVSSTELVEMLNAVFSRFDRLADQHGLEKIKTIGDAYMVVGGLPAPRPDHVRAMARMALDMRQALRDHVAATGRPLDVRIGLHTGPAVAGVIGVRKFSYDLWGDTVNTASRMESHGQPGKVHVSQAVRDALEGEPFAFEPRGAIAVKGKGDMTTFFLEA